MAFRDLSSLDLGEQLARAERAFARVSARPRPASERAPGCERACPDCSIACAVVAGAVADMRAETQRREGETGWALTHEGKRFHIVAGSA